MEELRNKIYRMLADTLAPTEDPVEITREIMIIIRTHTLETFINACDDIGI
jgi:hypothetical protein